MALLDTHITIEPYRPNPMPNGHDNLPSDAIPSRGTNSVNYVSAATDQAAILGAKNGQFNIVQSQTITTTGSTSHSPGVGTYGSFSDLLYQVPHGLSYTPGILAFMFFSDGTYIPLPGGFSFSGGGSASWSHYKAKVDSTNVYIYVDSLILNTQGNDNNLQFKYYLTQQTAS